MGFGFNALPSVGQDTKQRQLVLFIEGYAYVMPTEPLILKARRGPHEPEPEIRYDRNLDENLHPSVLTRFLK
jgi:hypothetical protein